MSRKVDYEYNIFETGSLQWKAVKQLYDDWEQLQKVKSSETYNTRQECYNWIEQQERENEQ